VAVKLTAKTQIIGEMFGWRKRNAVLG